MTLRNSNFSFLAMIRQKTLEQIFYHNTKNLFYSALTGCGRIERISSRVRRHHRGRRIAGQRRPPLRLETDAPLRHERKEGVKGQSSRVQCLQVLLGLPQRQGPLLRLVLT
jgi:hypothetical protein